MVVPATKMKTKELNFIGNDPGAVKYGNFINYYSFHSATQRISNLQPQMFPASPNEPVLCLDIGCNTGELTKELREYLKTVYQHSDIRFLALDIDPDLIQRAQESNSDGNISFQTLNIMDSTDCEAITEYLRLHERDKFDITFCFSVTMWIHINNGDDGLQHFLEYVKEISNTIVIEPQPWNCYRNAQRRVKKSGGTFPLYEGLKIRSKVDSTIEEILSKGSHKKVYESPSSSWNRIIQSYNRLT